MKGERLYMGLEEWVGSLEGNVINGVKARKKGTGFGGQ